jgi:hypothetical protein
MKYVFLSLWALALTVICNAQILTHSQFVISEDEGKPYSVYPIFSSTTKPKVAAAINKALQMTDFEGIKTPKNPGVFANQPQDEYTKWSYSVDYSNDRLLRVITTKWTPPGGMHTPAYTATHEYFFDTFTGDRVYVADLFTQEGFKMAKQIFRERLTGLATKRFDELVKKYPDNKGELPTLESCLPEMMTTVEKYAFYFVKLNADAKNISFEGGWCSEGDYEIVPELLGDTFGVTLKTDELKDLTSQSWNYYVARGQPRPVAHPINHTWAGTLGGKIPLTLVIRLSEDGKTIGGQEVYDNYGGGIKIEGGRAGEAYWLNERDNNNNKVGYFEFTAANSELVGVWKKADGSKTMEFRAKIAGAN